MIYQLKSWFESLEGFLKNIYDSFISIIKVIVLSKFNVKLPKTDKKECVVLGNGPSLKNVLEKHRDFLVDKSLICVNAFPSTDEYVKLKPSAIVWLDSAFYASKDKESLKQKRPDLIKLYDDVIERTSWPVNIYLPTLAKNVYYINEIAEKNPHIKISYFNYTIVKGFPFFRNFLFKSNLGMPLCQNVLGACIFLALSSGYKKIDLVGADHTWMQNLVVGEDNELYTKHTHFYDADKAPVYTKVYKSPTSKEKLNLSGYYMVCVKTFQTYYDLEEYSQDLKAKIYNATEGSYIDAFERIKL